MVQLQSVDCSQTPSVSVHLQLQSLWSWCDSIWPSWIAYKLCSCIATAVHSLQRRETNKDDDDDDVSVWLCRKIGLFEVQEPYDDWSVFTLMRKRSFTKLDFLEKVDGFGLSEKFTRFINIRMSRFYVCWVAHDSSGLVIDDCLIMASLMDSA